MRASWRPSPAWSARSTSSRANNRPTARGGRRAHRPVQLQHEGAGGRDRRAPGGGRPTGAPERGRPARHRNHRQDHRDLADSPPTSTTSWPTKSPLCLTRPMRRCVSGMSATAIITTAEVDDVILVPNRYHHPGPRHRQGLCLQAGEQPAGAAGDRVGPAQRTRRARCWLA